MQPIRSAKLLEDIRDAAAFITDITAPLGRDGFLADRVVRQAAERNFQIIGEAARRLSAFDAETAARLGPVARMVAFRNIIVHGYDILDQEVVWSVIETDLPKLLENATALLRKAGE